MKKIYLLLLTVIISAGTFAQTVDIVGNPGTSGNVVIGLSNYHVSESIYTDAEIGAGNFITAGTAIQQVNFFASTLGTPTNINSFRIYMKNVASGTTTLATGAYSTAGYTQVFNGTFNATPLGIVGVTLTTPFVRTAGTNLQVLIERVDNVIHGTYVFNCAVGNAIDAAALSTRRYNAAVAPVSGVTSLTASNFRPAIQFKHVFAIDAGVADIVFPNPSCFNTPQTISVIVANEGTSNIAPGAASATIRVRGANTFTGTASNAALIAPGGTSTISFAGVNLNNAGFTIDTAFVTLAGDGTTFNDTLVTLNSTATTLNTFPQVEDVEADLPVFPFASAISGGQLWGIQDGDYTNTDQTLPLVARAPGTISYLFDSYSGGSTLGFSSRLYSNCISLPPASTPKISFWMSHDNIFPTDLDSLYLSVSTNKGLTWTRLSPGYQRPDAAATTPVWRQENVSLAAYAGQTIQIGFEGVSKYGNAFSIDDIIITASNADANVDSIGMPQPTCFSAPVTIPVRLRNTGTTNIPAAAASVTLKIRGSNTFTGTLTNPALIAPGATALINFTGVNLNNPGENFDTAYVTYAADLNKLNDTIVTSSFSLVNLNTFPQVEDAEAPVTFPVFNYVQLVAGDRFLWTLNTGNYTNFDQTVPLVPQAPGSTFFQFDSYSGTSSDGFITRLYSNCITLPSVATSAIMTFNMSHDNLFPALLDSMYVTISTDKGLTWNRMLPGYGRYDAAGATPFWRLESKDLIAYAGQTILIGFEGVSKYGNAFGLDNISIIASPTPVSLLNFDAQRNGSVNNLTWSTSQEQNSSKFIVERSTNGVDFSEIGVVAAAGNSNITRNYRFTDAAPAKGINYYRLRMVDVNNSFKNSVIRNVRNLGVSEFSFAPNPVQDIMKLSVDADKADKGTIIVTDMSGKQVISRVVNVISGINKLDMDMSTLSKGSYIIQVQLSDTRIVKKFNKM